MFRKIATAAIAAALVGATVVASPAYAQPVKPRANEGIISMTTRTCGSATSWRQQAAHNHITAASGYLVLRTRTYDIDCPGGLSTNAVRRPTPKAPASTSRISRVIAFARAQIGEPYDYGSAGPNRWDCSGLIVGAYRSIGVRLPHYTGDLIHRGQRVSRSQLRPGDLVFLSRHHVGLYIGGNRMIVAPHSGAHVRIQTVYAFWAGVRI